MSAPRTRRLVAVLVLLSALRLDAAHYAWIVPRPDASRKDIVAALSSKGAMVLDEGAGAWVVEGPSGLKDTNGYEVIALPPLNEIGHWTGPFDPIQTRLRPV